MAGIIKADTIYGESSLRLNVGEVTLINVNATAFNVAQPLNVQTNATITGNLTVLTDATFSGNVRIEGTQFITNTEILVVEDKNIEIANVASPTTTTANGAGLSIRTGNTAAGSRDPSIQWELPNQSFLINQGIDIQQVTERANVSANTLNGVSNFDVLEGAVKFYTNAPTGNWTINIRGNSSNTFDSITATGDSVTVAYLANNGGTAYYQTAVQIDGFGRLANTKWQGGSAPSSGNANSIDIYSLTLLKTAANQWTVLASQTQYA
jgi:hypothetical protein